MPTRRSASKWLALVLGAGGCTQDVVVGSTLWGPDGPTAPYAHGPVLLEPALTPPEAPTVEAPHALHHPYVVASECRAIAYPDLSSLLDSMALIPRGTTREARFTVTATGTSACQFLGRTADARVGFDHCSVLEPGGFECDAATASPYFAVKEAPDVVLEPGESADVLFTITAPAHVDGLTLLAARIDLELKDVARSGAGAPVLVRPVVVGATGDRPHVFAFAAPPTTALDRAALDFGTITGTPFIETLRLRADPRLPADIAGLGFSPDCAGAAELLLESLPASVEGSGLALPIRIGPGAPKGDCHLEIRIAGGSVHSVPIEFEVRPELLPIMEQTTVTLPAAPEWLVVVDDSASMAGFEGTIGALLTALRKELQMTYPTKIRIAVTGATAASDGALPDILTHAPVPPGHVGGDRVEALAHAAARAATSMSESGLRDPLDALEILIVANEDDASPAPLPLYLASIRGVEPGARVHVLRLPEAGAACDTTTPVPALARIESLALYTGGHVGSLCGTTPKAVAKTLAAPRPGESLMIWLDGLPLPGSDVRVTSEDCVEVLPAPTTRRLAFESSCLGPVTPVRVYYQPR
ncbi:MAG: hypothetical protein IV100_32685 [Myxococcales bacterium]|nr:hypothetical protein [Myxococcales bacterium]